MKKISILLALSIAIMLTCSSCGNPKKPIVSSNSTNTVVFFSETSSEEDVVSMASEVSEGFSQNTSAILSEVNSQPETPSFVSSGNTSSDGKIFGTTSIGTNSKQEEKDDMDKIMRSFFNVMPKVIEVSDYNPKSAASGTNQWSNIKAITYDGAKINGKKTKVFAYIGFPANASASSKVPAMVLVHGGGGHAYAEWVKLWNDRGYAAIAMDTTGFFPSESGKGLAGREGENAAWWNYGLYGPFSQAGYVNAPNNDEMRSYEKPLEEQWMYHAVSSTILAHNILLTDNRVNIGKIGITGISWGGIITSLAIGYDNRYALAIPIYGSGYLEQSHSYMKNLFANSKTQELWSAADRFKNVKFPTLWLSFANDLPFSVNTNSRSYEAVKGAGGILSIKQNWSHSHNAGYAAQESYHFADSICKGGGALVSCVTEPSGRNIDFKITVPADAKQVLARAYYLTSKLSYSSNGIEQMWRSMNCTVNGDSVTGMLPADAVNYYVELTVQTPSGSYVSTTKFVENVR